VINGIIYIFLQSYSFSSIKILLTLVKIDIMVSQKLTQMVVLYVSVIVMVLLTSSICANKTQVNAFANNLLTQYRVLNANQDLTN
jgi:hypothetical protein